MSTSSSSLIIILVLNIFFSIPSFVSSRETRNDDITFTELQTLVQQQAAMLQTVQAKLTADENTAHQQAATIQQHATLLQTLQAKLTADENTAHQQAALLQTLQAKVAADESVTQLQGVIIQQQGVTIQQQAALLQTLQAKQTADENTAHQQAALLQTLQAKVAADESVTQKQAATIQQQTALLQTLQTKMATAENTTNTLQAQLSAVQARQDKNVAFTSGFSAGFRQSVDLGEPHGIIRFDQAITNIGGGYHTSTGLFTSPVAGVYAFTLNIRSDNIHDYIVVEMTKDGNTHLCTTVAEDPREDFYDKSSCSAVVHLNVGEQVFARRSGGASTFLEEGPFTALTGFLVHAD